MTKSYHGCIVAGFGSVVVCPAQGWPYSLPPRLDLAHCNPAGYAWGYVGSAPAQLSLALLADLRNDQFALGWYDQLHRQWTATLAPAEEWTISDTALTELVTRIVDLEIYGMELTRSESWT
jgi:hypothetical protein